MTLADARRYLIRLLLYRYLQLDLRITTGGAYGRAAHP